MKHANDNNPSGLRFLSVCSGIEAASVAWHPLGWQAVAFSEIEKFPSAVLKHHYPDVPNLGDFTKIDVRTLGRVDIFCGGTPCQAFSVAGLRQSLADERGNLSLEFVRLAHELAARNGLRNVVWENVVGVLSTKDNAFGCFLAGLVGADSAIEPPRRGKWPGAGMVSGPKGRAAWRVLDAQYFGVAQRRRRVIVVADFGNGADPAAVLFEQDGMRRHSPPSREKGEGAAPTISARTKGGGGLGTDFDLDGGLLHVPEIARCVATREGSSQDYETTTMVAHAIQAGALRTNPNSGPDGVGVQADIAYTLEARAEVQAVAFAENSRAELRLEGGDGQTVGVLGAGGGKPGQGYPAVLTSAVRRLTPRECERLQGFPDDYTAIPWRGKTADQCPDGPRYKALGNSWAVPKFAWLGRRIQALMPVSREAANDNTEETRIAHAA